MPHDEALRVVRWSAIITSSVIALALASSSVAVATSAGPWGWFTAGWTSGIALCVFFGFLTLRANLRRKNVADAAIRDGVVVVLDAVSDELRARGSEFEAVLCPGEAVLIRRREMGFEPPQQQSQRLH